jgi:hypothetical protein
MTKEWKGPLIDFSRLIISTKKTIRRNIPHVATTHSDSVMFTVEVMGHPNFIQGYLSVNINHKIMGWSP